MPIYRRTTRHTVGTSPEMIHSTLAKDLGLNRSLSDLLSRKIAQLAPRMSLSASLYRKLLDWLYQLAFLKRKEIHLINAIDKIEKKHLAHRKMKKLVKARARKLDKEEIEPAPRNKKNSTFWLLLMMTLFEKPAPK